MDQARELEEKVRALTAQVDEMRRQLGEMSSGAENGHKTSSRRNFIKLGGAAALGAVGMAATKVLPAAAATGGPVLLGTANVAENPTSITGDTVGPTGNPIPVFAAAAQSTTWVQGTTGTFSGPLQGQGTSGTNADGVDGWAGGTTGFAVYGVSDAGYGVVGESTTGIALYARRSGRLRQEPLVAAGIPGYTPNSAEQVRDANEDMWISAPTAPGGWKKVATTDLGMHLFPNPRRIYDGEVQPQAPGTYGPVDATTQVSTSGWPGGPSGVPAGAQAAFCAVQSYSAGVMTLYPDGTTDPGIANWSGTANGPLNLLYMFVPLSSAGKFKLHTYFNGKKYIDVWGYFI